MKKNHIYWRAEFARKTYLVFCDKKANWLRVAVNELALYDELYKEDVKHMAILAMLGDILSVNNNQ